MVAETEREVGLILVLTQVLFEEVGCVRFFFFFFETFILYFFHSLPSHHFRYCFLKAAVHKMSKQGVQ